MPAQTNQTVLQKYQAALETTRGTAITATRKLYAQISPSYSRPLATFTDQSGTFANRRRIAYGRQQVGFSCTDVGTFEDLGWWLQLAMKGGVTGGAGPTAYTYVFTPNLTADDLKSMTLEFGEPANGYKSTQVMCNSFTIRGDSDSDTEPAWMYEAEMLGRDIVSIGSSFTNLSDRTTEVILTRGTKVYIQNSDTFTTELSGRVISFSFTGTNNVAMKAYIEDELSMAADKVARGERTFDCEFTMEFDGDSGTGQEFANLRNATGVKRYVRIERTGTQLVAGPPAVTKKATIDMIGYLTSISWGDRDGAMTATYGISGFYDAVAGFDAKITVVNGESAYT